MKTKAILLLAVVGSAFFSLHAPAQDDLPLVKPEVKTLAAFKNGLGFVFKSGEAELQDGWAGMDGPPAATLGSLWIGTTSKTGRVTDVVSYSQKVAESSEAVTMAELLSANVGKRVAVTYTLGAASSRVEGTLLSVPADRQPDEIPPTPTPRPWENTIVPPPTEPERGDMVVIRSQSGNKPLILAVNKFTIQSVELLDSQELDTHVDREQRRVKFHIGGNPRSAEITLGYLEKGVIWSPSYRLNIADDKTAELSLDAVLADDAENLTNAEVSFVVGYPHFLYADVPSPLSLRQSVADFVQTLLADGQGNAYNRAGSFANNMMQSANYGGVAPIQPQDLYSAGEPLPGEGNEDLYFYKKSGVTLKQGDRAQFEVFSASVPYEHIYQWEVSDNLGVDDNGYRRNAGGPIPPEENQIWHMLRLTNDTKQPWTTAPAFTMNGQLPVAQDMLGYAPPGGSSTLKLTVATDLHAEATQTEQDRRQVNLDGNSFDEITVIGKLKVTSWKSSETCILIHKSLTGEVLDAGDGKVTKSARNLAGVNPTSEINWEFHLPAGKDRELNYQYKVLVRR